MRTKVRTVVLICILYLLITFCSFAVAANSGQASYFQDEFSDKISRSEKTGHPVQTTQKKQEAQTEDHASDTSLPPVAEHNTSHDEHGSNSLLGPIINFLFLFGGLTLVLRKPIARFFKNYTESVQNNLTDAAASRTTSEASLKKINARLHEMAGEAKDIRIAAEEAGKADYERILESARDAAEKIKAKTAADIDLISQFGVKALKKFIVDLAVARARANILGTLKPEDQPGLIDKSIERLERIHAKNGSA